MEILTCVVLPIAGNRSMENACVALRYVLLHCGIFYVVFNKFRKSLRCITLRYLLLEIALKSAT